MTKVVNFYAPPGSGKSTLASACFVEYGYQGKNVQCLDEFIKTHADRAEYRPTAVDQLWIMGNQSQATVNAVRAGYSHIFCHSDALLCAWFCEWYNRGSDYARHTLNLALSWEKLVAEKYGVEFHRVFIDLPESVYRERFKEVGRWEDFSTVMQMQSHMREWLETHCSERLHFINETRPEQVFKRIEK